MWLRACADHYVWVTSLITIHVSIPRCFARTIAHTADIKKKGVRAEATAISIDQRAALLVFVERVGSATHACAVRLLWALRPPSLLCVCNNSSLRRNVKASAVTAMDIRGPQRSWRRLRLRLRLRWFWLRLRLRLRRNATHK